MSLGDYRPLLLWENLFESGTVTVTSEEPGWPVENLTDWRPGTGFRWKAGGLATQDVDVDLGVGITASPDAVAFAGHNLGTVGASFRVFYSDDGAAYTGVHTAVVAPTDNGPALHTWTPEAHRWWRFRILTGPFSEEAHVGVLTLGRALALEGAPASLDWLSTHLRVKHYRNERGLNLGSNLETDLRRFLLDFPAGLPVSSFFEPVSGIGFSGLEAHLRASDPFWIAHQNSPTATAYEAHLVRGGGLSSPFVGNATRRDARLELEAVE